MDEAIPDIKQLSNEVIDFYNQRLEVFDGITIYHSPKLRASQTAAVVAEVCVLNQVNAELVEIPALREMRQGRFVIKNNIDGEDYPPLMNAWLAFREKLDRGNLFYRFGDPLIRPSGNVEYPQLLGLFTEYGENQKEFSLRLYAFLRDYLSAKDKKLHIIIAHQATSSRIQRIFNVLTTVPMLNLLKAGDFVSWTERDGVRISIDPACGVVIPKPSANLAVGILEREITYLESVYDSSNG